MSTPMTPLGKVARYIGGITFKPDDKIDPEAAGAVTCMRTKNIQDSLDESDRIAIPPQFVKRDEQFLRHGDILVSSANSWNLVGKCCWVPSLDYPATAGGFISVVRARESAVDARYLYHWLSSGRTQHAARHCARQTTNIANLSRERFLQLQVPLPTITEQRRIAAILDKADAIRRKRREAIALTEELLRSTFLEMFGDPVTNPKGWPVAPLGKLAEFIGGGTPSRRRAEYFTGTIPWATPKDMQADLLKDTQEHITPAAIEASATKLVPSDSLLVVVKSKVLARRLPVARTEVQTCFGQDLKAIVPRDPGRVRYLHRHLQAGASLLLRQARGANTEGLTLTHLRTFPVMLPPSRVVASFDTFERRLLTARQLHVDAADESDDLFHSLVQRAFRGDL